MNDKKLTDSEIVKALECCSEENKCKQCPYYNKGNFKCLNYKFFKDLLDLINRLQEKDETRHKVFETKCEELEIAKAENERLKEKAEKCFYCTEQANKKIGEVKAEAYKEFAERLKEKGFILLHHKMILSNDIDNLLKELVGEDDG